MPETTPAVVGSARAAQAVRARRRFTVTLDGIEFLVRRVSPLELLREGILPPAVAAIVHPGNDLEGFPGDTVEERREAASASLSIEDKLAFTRTVCRLGMVQPRLWDGAPDACPEDAVLWEDICDDIAGGIVEACSGRATREDARVAQFPRAEADGGSGAEAGASGGAPPDGVSAADVP
jgi:hypothetical protein